MSQEVQPPIAADIARRRRISLTDRKVALAVAAMALLLRAPLLRWGINLGDEGYLAYGVDRILHGQVMYLDFERVYVPGIQYLFVPLFKVFGPSLVVTRVVWLLCLCALSYMTYMLVRPLVPRWAAVWAALVPVLASPPVHKMYLPLCAVAALTLARYIAMKPRLKQAILAGAGIGLISMCRQDIGVYSFLTACFAVAASAAIAGVPGVAGAVRRALKVCVVMACAAAAIWVPVVAAFAAKGALHEMVSQIVFDGFRDERAMWLPLPTLASVAASKEPVNAAVQMLLFGVPSISVIIGLVIVAVAAARRKLAMEHVILAQWTLMALFMHSAFTHRSDFRHLVQILVVPSLVLAYALGKAAGRVRRGPARLPAAVGLAACAALAVTMAAWGAVEDLGASYKELAKARIPLDEERASVLPDAYRLRSTRQVLRSIRNLTAPGEPIFVAPYASMFYFLSERPNATRYDSVLPGTVSRVPVQEEIIRCLDKEHVRLIIVDDIPFDNMEERRFPAYMPLVADYLKRNFTQYARHGEWLLLVRRELPVEPPLAAVAN